MQKIVNLLPMAFFLLISNSAFACFETPYSKPLIGCMPFNFEASGPGDSIDWGLYSFTQGLRKGNEEIDDAQIRIMHRAYYPQEACARRSSSLHISLIERLYAQMQRGQNPDASLDLGHDLDFSSDGRYDGKAVFKIKEYPSEFVREYYPHLFAIIRDFEGCMVEIMEQGCPSGSDCKILDFRWMGYLPDESHYDYVETIPSFENDGVTVNSCEKKNGFDDCADGGAFASDAESYAAFGSEPSESREKARMTEFEDQEVESSNQPDGIKNRLTVQGYIEDVLIGEALGQHPVLDAAVIGVADMFDVRISDEALGKAIIGIQLDALQGVRGNLNGSTTSPEFELLLDKIQ